MSHSADQLPDDVVDALGRGHTIDAIKRLREARGLGLAEAKSLVDAYRADNNVGMPALEAKKPAVLPKRREGNLSPGEMPAAGAAVGWMVALAGAGLALYLVLR
jgi:hypothetical protein